VSMQEVIEGLMGEAGSFSFVDHIAAKIMEAALQGGQMPSVTLVDDSYLMAEAYIERAKRGKGTRDGA